MYKVGLGVFVNGLCGEKLIAVEVVCFFSVE